MGAIGGGVGIAAKAGLSALLKTGGGVALGNAFSRLGGLAKNGLGKIVPSLGARFERTAISAGMKALDDIAETGLPSYIGKAEIRQSAQELALENMFDKGSYGLRTWLHQGLMTPATKVAYGLRAVVGTSGAIGGEIGGRVVLPSYG